MKKPERFAWDDDMDNDHGWYDAEAMDKYLALMDQMACFIKNNMWFLKGDKLQDAKDLTSRYFEQFKDEK